MNDERIPRALTAAAVLGSGAALAWFVRANGHPPAWDEAWYLEVSYRFWHALTGEGPLSFARAWAAAFRFKAPLVSALPMPFYLAFGHSYATAVLTNIPALALLAAALYGLGRRFSSPAGGASAAVLGLMMPLTVALSHTYFVETWLTALTAAFLWRLAESDQLRREREAPMLGLLFGLGLLTKVLFPGVVAAPLALTLWQRRGDPRGPDWPALERPLKVFVAVALGISLTWYGPNLVYVTGFALSAYRGGIGAHYGTSAAWGVPQVAAYFNSIAAEILSWYTVLLTLGLGVVLRRRLWRWPGLAFAGAWVFPYLVITTSGLCKDQRYVAPAVPGVALALGLILDEATRGRRGRPVLLAAGVLPLVGCFLLQTFGDALPASAASSLSRVFPPKTEYGGPPQRTGELGLEAFVTSLAGRLPPGSVVTAGLEHRRLNANLLAAAAAQRDLPLSFIHYGHMEGDLRRVLIRLVEKDATHILFVEGLPLGELPPMVLQVDAALRAHARAGRLPLRRVGSFLIAPGVSGELWERTGPIRMSL